MDSKNSKEVKGLSRREFLRGAGMAAAGAAAIGVCPAINNTYMVNAEEEGRIIDELPIPAVEAPDKTEYSCDVLVVGGGFAGLNAAVAAKQAGQSVVLIDKGRPGYSGLTPFPSSHRWFDPEMGDDADAFRSCINRGGEWIGNMDWFEVWINESKETYERLMDWGILTQFPKASDAGNYVEREDYAGYRDDFAEFDRRTKWIKVLVENEIEYVENTMVTNVIEQDGKVVGAMGFHVPSGTVISCSAKAVVLCMGGGCYRPTGFPVGGDTFDGEYITYQLGLPIAGKEFDDFHMTCSWAPGNAFRNNNWVYLENIWLCGGDITPDTAVSYATTKQKVMVLDRVTKAVTGVSVNDGSAVEDMSQQNVTRKGGTANLETHPEDIRTGKDNDTMFKGDVYGAAVGMCAHLSSGVFCGLDDLVGYTGIPGLYVAGDGMNASAVTGATYPVGVGFTSNFTSIQGNRAGKAAAEYAAGVEMAAISDENLQRVTAEILAPSMVENGFDPNWARDMLMGIMAPYWTLIVKNEANLKAALTQVEYMRDNVIPKLAAPDSHTLRLAHEMKHKVLSAEMKLRASLAREETRGLSYRSDFPYRDDENFLCYITVQKAEDGTMTVDKVPVKDEWKGDLAAEYTDRYKVYYPGEREAKGIPEEEQSSGGWGH